MLLPSENPLKVLPLHNICDRHKYRLKFWMWIFKAHMCSTYLLLQRLQLAEFVFVNLCICLFVCVYLCICICKAHILLQLLLATLERKVGCILYWSNLQLSPNSIFHKRIFPKRSFTREYFIHINNWVFHKRIFPTVSSTREYFQQYLPQENISFTSIF